MTSCQQSCLLMHAPPYTVMTLHSFGAMLQQMADITTPSLVTQVLLLSRPGISSICIWVLHIIRFLSNQPTSNYTLTLFAQLQGIILYHHQLDLASSYSLMFQLLPAWTCFTVSQMELHHQTHSTGKLVIMIISAVYVLVNNVQVKKLNR